MILTLTQFLIFLDFSSIGVCPVCMCVVVNLIFSIFSVNSSKKYLVMCHIDVVCVCVCSKGVRACTVDGRATVDRHGNKHGNTT